MYTSPALALHMSATVHVCFFLFACLFCFIWVLSVELGVIMLPAELSPEPACLLDCYSDCMLNASWSPQGQRLGPWCAVIGRCGAGGGGAK